jgi:N-acetylmuramoyl-L-alanine amidase
MSFSERELIARLIQCEAGGEGENGMKGVATVIMNRVNVPYGEYARISQRRKYKKYYFSKRTI